jgi:prepilin-type N-terminal cleavage/methylation domain-containing protein
MSARVPAARPGHRGFTLVELLTVIAIIAILAGLLFPVLATAREQARKGTCSSNIQQIIQALKMYKDDWRVYPEALYAIQYPNGPIETRLYPEYVKDRGAFNCPNSWVKTPAQDPGPQGMVSAANLTTNQATPYGLAPWSSYDFQYRPNNNSPTAVREGHYFKKWTAIPPGPSDMGNQLAYKEPPDHTVVTWCLYHAGNMDGNGNLPANGIVLVGFLSSRVQSIPYSQLPVWSQNPPNGPWNATPKP